MFREIFQSIFPCFTANMLVNVQRNIFINTACEPLKFGVLHEFRRLSAF